MEITNLCLSLLLVALVSAEQCTSPTVSTSTYTSRNVALSAETAYIAEFNVQCSEGVASLDLFAEVEPGVITPIASIPEKEGSYQISWAKDHKKAQTGKINVKVFNSEGYSAYRKAQRNEEDVSAVKPLFTVAINHPGVSREGLFVQTEFLAVVAALLLFWTANSMRNQIME